MGLLFDTPEQVKHVIDGMRGYYVNTFRGNSKSPPPVQVMNDRIGMVRKASEPGGRMWLIEHSENFRMIGSCALEVLGPEFDFDKFYTLLENKHKLYTDAPLREWNELGVVIRISSKVKRYEEVVKKLIPQKRQPDEAISVEPVPPFETSVDTMQDILGYAVLGFLLTRERATQVEPTE